MLINKIKHEDNKNGIKDRDLVTVSGKGKADLIIADPAYGNNYAPWDKAEELDHLIDDIYPALSDNGAIIMFNTQENLDKIWAREDKLRPRRLKLMSKDMRWIKTNQATDYSKYRYTMRAERLMWLSKTDHPTFHLLPGESYASGFFYYGTTKSYVKPRGLIQELILRHSNPGDLIYEPFAGTAPVFREARQLLRSSVSYELDDRAFNRLVERWELNSSGQTTLKDPKNIL